MTGETASTLPDAHSVEVTTWVASNPFGEATAFLLLCPAGEKDLAVMPDIAAALGLLRTDHERDIPWVGTDFLAWRVNNNAELELRVGERVWLSSPVTEAWAAEAHRRRYLVLAIGREVYPFDSRDAELVASYVQQPDRIFAGLVKLA